MKLNVTTYIVGFLFLICSCSSESTDSDNPSRPADEEENNGDEGNNQDPIVLPEVKTLDIGELLISYAEFNGELISEGDSPVIEIGFVISTEEGATIESNFSRHPIPEEASDNFSLIVYDIPADINFYLRAYALNADGVGYGNDIAFKTLEDNAFEGNVHLDTQEKVVNFGEMGITTINGNLTITGTVTDLSPLSSLERVRSAIDIISTSELKTLHGLDNLTHTGYLTQSPLRIISNSGLESLQGLNGLVNAAGGIMIGSIDSLVDLKGLDSLQKVEGKSNLSLYISNCASLNSLEGLNNLESVRDLHIAVNPLLSDISALANLANIENSLTIHSCPSLVDLNGIQSITRLTEISILNNDGITNLKGLENIDEVQTVVISDNEILTDVTALGGIGQLESLVFSRNDTMVDFQGLERITFVSTLSIEDNSILESFAGLENLEEVNELYVNRNPIIKNFNGLEGLKRISNNNSLKSILGIFSNPELISLEGLGNLASLEGDLTITNNGNLSNFCALDLLFDSNGPGREIVIEDNNFNPSPEEMSTGTCSQ